MPSVNCRSIFSLYVLQHALNIINSVICIKFSDFVQLTDNKHRGRCVEIYDLQFSSATLCCRFYRSFVDHHRFFRLGQSGMSPKLIGASSSKARTFERLPDHRLLAGNERSRSVFTVPNHRSPDADGRRDTVKKCNTPLRPSVTIFFGSKSLRSFIKCQLQQPLVCLLLTEGRTWLLCWRPQDRVCRSGSSTSIVGPMNEQPNVEQQTATSHRSDYPSSDLREQAPVLEPPPSFTHQSSASLSEIPSSFVQAHRLGLVQRNSVDESLEPSYLRYHHDCLREENHYSGVVHLSHSLAPSLLLNEAVPTLTPTAIVDNLVNREPHRRLSVDCRLHLSDGRRDSLSVALSPLHLSFPGDSPLTNTSLNDLRTASISESFDCNQSVVGWLGPVVRTHTVLIHADGRRVQFDTQNEPAMAAAVCFDLEKMALTSPLFVSYLKCVFV
ncbi:uncharacterized protein DEA37_0011066 [Paragonimus westermani]|uniref:Uncharacterized protein n=1 Tax=Paragonimus westermani TaxID=34504 RepID=A0A5J4NIZ5_9TREM|nr:uncharacterized protein DEA37_0011066 [Paragonimus westermani]